MNYLYISCLFLLFFFSLINPLTCVSSKLGIGLCESQFKCGNITASFPFWGGNRPKLCGHPLLELRCIENITNLHISNYEYKVYHVDQPSNTIRLARKDQLGSFCGSRFNTTTSFPDIFELSPIYKRLNVLYNCDPTLSYPSSYSCPNLGRFSISQNLDYQYYCQDSFTVNVPSRFVLEERELDLSNLEGVLRKGFEMRLVIDERACQKCLSSGGMCGFKSTTQICCNINSTSGGVSCLQQQPSGKELYDLCKYDFSCGGRNYLNYPFWIPGREECGHPDFKLNCTGGIAKIIISSVEFIILTRWRDEVYTLVRSDYMDTLFQRNPLDVKFDEKVVFFRFSVELLTIYYDCPSFSGSMSGSSYIRELDYGYDVRDYYVTKNLTSPLLNESRGLLNNLREMCKRNVSIPASGSGLETLQRNPTPYNLKHALEQGFDLSVNSECVTCLRCSGVCGYNHTSRAFVCYCKNGDCSKCSRNSGFGDFVITFLLFIYDHSGLVGALAVVIVILVLLLCPCFGVQISRKRKRDDERRLKKLKALIPLKHYTYKQVKKITKSFAEVVGKGGFGIVYKGTLRDGRMVAVKVLKDSKGNGEDFINEVASMSQTSHVNIVSLLGFCSEGSKRAIIYELLRNGSLDKFISDKTSRSMDLTTLYSVSLGVARGLDYLHFGCKTRIVHFDIKPQNVLLDENFCPKVSDFGLAKLCDKKESIMSLLETRGTIGYIAPEMISRVYGNISHKSDVYSYGMLVLEMIGARKKESFDQNSTSNTSTSTMYFPEWIYKDLEKEDNGRLIGNEINIEEEEITKKMTLVGLWCIQSSPSNRPTMNKVVEMMEGNSSALEVPPRPVLQEISMVSPFESADNSAERSSASKILICSTNESS